MSNPKTEKSVRVSPSDRRKSSVPRPLATLALTDHDVYLFREGTHFRLYEKLGAHIAEANGLTGVRFAVWAPNAYRVFVSGTFNGFSPSSHPMSPVRDSGFWEVFVPGVEEGAAYKYRIVAQDRRSKVDKSDPFGFRHEEPPRSASFVHSLDYKWRDTRWMTARAKKQSTDQPISIYEVHLGSWLRDPDDPKRFLNYLEIAEKLALHVTETGFTHVELMPIMEHPYYGSWGYQVTGFFAPSSRFGTAQDFMGFVDHLHQRGIGVILDWVPSHFPADGHGLAYFDGTHLYEYGDPKRGYHQDWKSYIFDYGRPEVRSFLCSSAAFWLDRYHLDGIRVDAVASMLYLDYSRKEGQWIPNKDGGRENFEAIDFLKTLNTGLYGSFPDITTTAEESTAWPLVSRPTYDGGLGFGMKWDMGRMNDTLEYMKIDPFFRSSNHHKLTFRMIYAWSENYVLPLSHDEVVHGKGSLINKMPGNRWQRFANLRTLYSYMWTQPGKKLLFMGGEIAQEREWSHERGLDWHLLRADDHAAIKKLVSDLNKLYRKRPSLHRFDTDPRGFEWIDADDATRSVLTYLRKGEATDLPLVVALNLTPVPRHDYHVAVPIPGSWKEIFNSDAAIYGGSDTLNRGSLKTTKVEHHRFPQALSLTLPPLGAIILSPVRPRRPRAEKKRNKAASPGPKKGKK